jgi:hypothetical protein
MSFEKRVLEVADECGIDGAYFYEGSMFMPATPGNGRALSEFTETYPELFNGAAVPNRAGDEYAVDFVLNFRTI